MKKIKWWYSVFAIAVILVIACTFLLISQRNPAVPLSDLTWFAEINSAESEIADMYGQIPNAQEGRRGVKIQDGSGWQVYRLFPSGYLEVFHKNSAGNFIRIELPANWRKDTHPMLFIPTQNRLWVVGYDVLRSGRALQTKQNGLDLFEINPDVDKKAEPRLLASGIDLDAGIDSLVYGRLVNSTISLCAERKCADIKIQDGGVNYWSLNTLKEYEFVDVAFGYNTAYAIIRKKWDDRINGAITSEFAQYSLVDLSPAGIKKIQPISEQGIPFLLHVRDEKSIYKIAKSKEDFQDLFIYELQRMKNQGMIDYGENNLEGRVAWSQIYYLHGLISIASGGLGYLNEESQKKIRKRVQFEIELMSRLAEDDYPGYRVKRYFIDREPLLFALHLGRIVQLMVRAQEEKMSTPLVKEAVRKLEKELVSLERTVEYSAKCRTTSTLPCITLYYRQGVPFWADGVNVPFNYVSGYVGGLLSLKDNSHALDLSSDLMRVFQTEVRMQDSPIAWRYWGGEGQDGWTYQNGYSLNTTSWQGNAAGMDLAHITYRSMDSATLLMLYDRKKSSVTSQQAMHLKSLVEKGLLLPQVNEQLNRVGLRAKLQPNVAKRFSRSSQAWQIQSQVWALSDMTFHSNKND